MRNELSFLGNWLCVSLAICAVAAFSGCASVVSGTKQKLSFESNPSGALVRVGTEVVGTTPLIASVARKSAEEVTFLKDGFKPVTLDMKSGMNGWFWGNILCCGLLGSTTDGVSGAVHQYSDTDYMVTLEPLAASQLEKSTALTAQQKARDYIVADYQSIQADLRRGQGDSLAPLFQVLHIPKDAHPSAMSRLKVLLETYADPAAFSQQAVNTYLGDR